jgi:hypothetical protein
MKLHKRTLVCWGALFFALAAANPAWAQFGACLTTCVSQSQSCLTPCINNNGMQVNCGIAGFLCTPPCNSQACTPSTPCSQQCGVGTTSTCGSSGFACCAGNTLINRVRLCKAQFFKTAKNVCVVFKRFDDTYERCDGSTFEVNPDQFVNRFTSDAASCPSICEPGCEDLCQ